MEWGSLLISKGHASGDIEKIGWLALINKETERAGKGRVRKTPLRTTPRN